MTVDVSPRTFHHESTFAEGPRRMLLPEEIREWARQVRIAFENGLITRVVKDIAYAVSRFLGPDGQLTPTYKTIATAAHASRASVATSLATLRALGLLTWTRRLEKVDGRALQASNAYELLFPAALPPPEQFFLAEQARKVVRLVKRFTRSFSSGTKTAVSKEGKSSANPSPKFTPALSSAEQAVRDMDPRLLAEARAKLGKRAAEMQQRLAQAAQERR